MSRLSNWWNNKGFRSDEHLADVDLRFTTVLDQITSFDTYIQQHQVRVFPFVLFPYDGTERPQFINDEEQYQHASEQMWQRIRTDAIFTARLRAFAQVARVGDGTLTDQFFGEVITAHLQKLQTDATTSEQHRVVDFFVDNYHYHCFAAPENVRISNQAVGYNQGWRTLAQLPRLRNIDLVDIAEELRATGLYDYQIVKTLAQIRQEVREFHLDNAQNPDLEFPHERLLDILKERTWLNRTAQRAYDAMMQRVQRNQEQVMQDAEEDIPEVVTEDVPEMPEVSVETEEDAMHRQEQSLEERLQQLRRFMQQANQVSYREMGAKITSMLNDPEMGEIAQVASAARAVLNAKPDLAQAVLNALSGQDARNVQDTLVQLLRSGNDAASIAYSAINGLYSRALALAPMETESRSKVRQGDGIQKAATQPSAVAALPSQKAEYLAPPESGSDLIEDLVLYATSLALHPGYDYDISGQIRAHALWVIGSLRTLEQLTSFRALEALDAIETLEDFLIATTRHRLQDIVQVELGSAFEVLESNIQQLVELNVLDAEFSHEVQQALRQQGLPVAEQVRTISAPEVQIDNEDDFFEGDFGTLRLGDHTGRYSADSDDEDLDGASFRAASAKAAGSDALSHGLGGVQAKVDAIPMDARKYEVIDAMSASLNR